MAKKRRSRAVPAIVSVAAAAGATFPGRAQQVAAPARPVPIPPELHYWQPAGGSIRPESLQSDLCVYGGTSAGVMAAIQAARDGRSVVLVAPEAHLGGLTTGGLTYTDFGNKGAIGGIAREFYRLLGRAYGRREEWKFEPKVAEQAMLAMLRATSVRVRRRHFLRGVRMRSVGGAPRLEALITERGLTVRARMFIDATYEGDLLAKAGVRYTVGREGNAQYGETLNGVQIRDKHQFEHPVSPYVTEGDPSSGLLPGISPDPPAPPGTGDRKVQAYNFRMTLTRDPAQRLPYPKPEGYDPREYALLARYLRKTTAFLFGKYDALTSRRADGLVVEGTKFDKNNHGAISTDYIGQSWAWPEADYPTRERIFRRHVVYQQGLMWFLTNDPAVPEDVRRRLAEWGLPKDEFADTGSWPRQLYVREARRMVSDYVITEGDCRGRRRARDPIGLGSYGMDSHNCDRVIVPDGAGGVRVMNEGDVQAAGFPPYPISYRAIVPRRGECANLLVPICVSASHIAYGSVRMEPVFMILGQSAAVAAGLAADGDGAVQNVDYGRLRARLLELGQVLHWPPPLSGDRFSLLRR